MSGPGAIPLFGDAYLADTTHLTTEEHGVYLLLIMAAWRQEDCGLPFDDKKLARIVGLSTRKWMAIKDTILAFWKVKGERIFQPRLSKEHDFVCKKSNTNRNSANARWGKQAVEKQQSGSCERISERNAPPPPPLSLSKDNDAKDFWDRSKSYLGSGKSGMIGKWVSKYGKDATASAITQAQIHEAVDPVPYIETILRKANNGELEMPVC